MKLLSFKYVALRYIGAVTIITLAGLASNPSGLFVIIPVAFVSIKFLIYDGSVAAISSKFPQFKTHPWLLIGYCLTVLGDMLFTFSANRDAADAGFAFFGAFILTPWILLAALLAMTANTYLGRRK